MTDWALSDRTARDALDRAEKAEAENERLQKECEEESEVRRMTHRNRDTVQEAKNIIRLIEPLLGPIDCNRETVLLNLYEDIFFILSRHAGSDGEESETCTAIAKATAQERGDLKDDW